MKKGLIPVEVVANKIYLIRGQKVMLDYDLAKLYRVSTKRLNEQVRRNVKRFPIDFMFQLTLKEKEHVVANCDHLQKLKYSYQMPKAFTEQGVAMLSSVLKSERAIEVNIAIMRVFVKLRYILSTSKGLEYKFKEFEKKYEKHDNEIQIIFNAIRKLMEPPKKADKKIGFIKN